MSDFPRAKYLRPFYADGLPYAYVVKGKGRGAFRRKLTAPIGSPEFWTQYAAALSEAEGHLKPRRERVRTTLPDQGTVAELLANYYASDEYRALGADSQRVYRLHLSQFEDDHGHRPRAAITSKIIKQIIAAKAATPAAAANLRKRLRAVYRAAEYSELIEPRDNPTLGVAAPKYRKGEHAAWTEAEILQFVARWPLGTKPYTALVLALETVQRRGDLHRLGQRDLVRDPASNVIGHYLKQQKGGENASTVFVPLTEPLIAALAAAHAAGLSGETYLLTQHGKPYSRNGLGNAFHDWAVEAGVEKTLHGLRKTGCVRLVMAGATTAQGKSISGHKSTREWEGYIGSVDNRALSVQAMSLKVSSFTNYEVSRNDGVTPIMTTGQRFKGVLNSAVVSPAGFEPASPP